MAGVLPRARKFKRLIRRLENLDLDLMMVSGKAFLQGQLPLDRSEVKFLIALLRKGLEEKAGSEC